MTTIKTKRLAWTILFLGVTASAIVMECIAGLAHPAGTIPWTEYLARYVPWPFQLAAYVALAVWLPFHFWRHDHLRQMSYVEGWAEGRRMGRKVGHSEGHEEGYRAGRAATQSAWGPPELKDVHSQHLIDELASRGYDATFNGG